MCALCLPTDAELHDFPPEIMDIKVEKRIGASGAGRSLLRH